MRVEDKALQMWFLKIFLRVSQIWEYSKYSPILEAGITPYCGGKVISRVCHVCMWKNIAISWFRRLQVRADLGSRGLIGAFCQFIVWSMGEHQIRQTKTDFSCQLGTASYHRQGTIFHRSDVFNLGCCAQSTYGNLWKRGQGVRFDRSIWIPDFWKKNPERWLDFLRIGSCLCMVFGGEWINMPILWPEIACLVWRCMIHILDPLSLSLSPLESDPSNWGLWVSSSRAAEMPFSKCWGSSSGFKLLPSSAMFGALLPRELLFFPLFHCHSQFRTSLIDQRYMKWVACQLQLHKVTP